MLILLIIILLSAIILLTVLFLKDLLDFISKRSFYLRDFINRNSGIFTVTFIFLFFIEQIILIITTSYFFEIPSRAQFIISLFALLVLTTATFEKFILEKRNEYQQQETINITYQNEMALKEWKQLSEDYQELYKEYTYLKKQR
ncbi:hypothetical protein J4437_01080 [Candidatus Woesearchaeota archaeon]|nr:hypothetical protein [Candidatus Woesearchaeota archaeon]